MSERHGMPPEGYFSHYSTHFDACESLPELLLLQELVHWRRGTFAPSNVSGCIAYAESGVRLYQQHVVGRYRLDFALMATDCVAMLAVEVDGARFHSPIDDAERDEALGRLGWAVMRIPAKDVVRAGNVGRVADSVMVEFERVRRDRAIYAQQRLNEWDRICQTVCWMDGKTLLEFARSMGFDWVLSDNKASVLLRRPEYRHGSYLFDRLEFFHEPIAARVREVLDGVLDALCAEVSLLRKNGEDLLAFLASLD